MKKMGDIVNRFSAGMLCLVIVAGCSKQENKTPEPYVGHASESESAPAITADDKKNEENEGLSQLLANETLDDALGFIKPFARDGDDIYPSGAIALTGWIQSHNLSWDDIAKFPSTSYGKIMKDSQNEFGKRFCFSGVVIEIKVDRSMGKPIYNGGMVNDSLNIVRFTAVNSTGDIEARTSAKICGIVTGTMHYGNANGGTTTAPYLVGVFDLPENK